jgi:mannose-1-phosphate guanylyltransferase
MQYGVIMAGGSGTRLWPISRGDKPKQLLRVVHGKSLLQVSYDRLRGILPAKQIYVCTNAAHAALVLDDLPELPKENVIGEPVGRDTAAAVGFTAAVLKKLDPDAVCAVVTADHVIQPIADFQAALKTAFALTVDHPSALVTFGIVPTFGHTGLGYVHRGEPLATKTGAGAYPGAYRVLAFREKPDKPTADRYVESGRYYWNSGMFVWRADAVLKELEIHLPETYAGLAKIADAWGTSNQEKVVHDIYPKLKKISVDYAIMEPASQNKGKASVAVVEMPVQWLDVGSWTSLAETLSTDEHNNALECKSCLLVDSDDNIIFSTDPQHLVSTIGVSDMIIVHTPDATLICPKNESQRVKDLVGKIKEKFGDKFQ